MDEYKYSGKYDDPLLAELYDRKESYVDDITLLRRLIGDSGPLNILECFSGTGRIVIPLAEDGHMITGIEIAKSMNARAERKLFQLPQDVSARVELRVRDVLDGEWGSGYDLVILGANAFYELPSAQVQEDCVRLASEALRPNGLIFIDNNDYGGGWGKSELGQTRVVFEGFGADRTFGRYLMKSVGFDEADEILFMERTSLKRTPNGKETREEYICR